MRIWVGIGGHRIFFALAAAMILGVFPSSMIAHGWDDPTEGRPLLQVFKPSDYRTNARVSAATQDRDGVLYFASEGLLQYDGSSWRHYSADLGINGLAIDDEGRIWVGGYGVVGYFDKDISVAIQQIGGSAKHKLLDAQKRGAPFKIISVGSLDKTEKLFETRPDLEINDPSIPNDAWCNYFREDDVCATAYFYLNSPENGLPKLQTLEERIADLT